MEGFIAAVFGSATLRIRRVVHATLFQLVAAILLCVAIGFATAGGYIVLAEVHGPAAAAFAIAIAYATLGLLVLAVYAALYSGSARKAVSKIAPAAAPVEEVKDQMSDVIGDIAQNGFKPSHLALLSTLPGLRSIKPVHLAVLGLLAGFISGKKLGK